jgi:dihydroorotase
MAPNDGTLTLERGAPDLPGKIEAGGETVTVFDPGFPLNWRVARR